MHRALLLALVACSADGSKAPASQQPPTRSSMPAASGAPRRTPTLPEQPVSVADAERIDTPAAWSSVATSLAAKLDACTRDCKDLAHDLVQSSSKAVRALPTPPHSDDEWTALPVPAEVDVFVARVDRYVQMLEPTDHDTAPMKFFAGSALWRYGQDASLARFEEVLRAHRNTEVAEYAANMLLDALMRAGRTDELRDWVRELVADHAFLADKPDLQATLTRLSTLLAASP
jgi:hypothetical protein